MKCPQCSGGDCWRDEVDNGVGVQYGPWRCQDCGWYEGHEVDAMIDADRAVEKVEADTPTVGTKLACEYLSHPPMNQECFDALNKIEADWAKYIEERQNIFHA